MWSLLSVRLDEVENKLAATDKDFEAARRGAKDAKDSFAAIRKRRTNLFNKAYSHISESIDVVYKELTKGKASPMGGVAYLSLEDSEVGRNVLSIYASLLYTGTLPARDQVPCHATDEAFPGHGAAFGRRKDHGSVGTPLCHSFVSSPNGLHALMCLVATTHLHSSYWTRWTRLWTTRTWAALRTSRLLFCWPSYPDQTAASVEEQAKSFNSSSFPSRARSTRKLGGWLGSGGTWSTAVPRALLWI
jgi:hypothetical protein